MDSLRRCTRNSCERPAAATLTYSYKDSTVVVGPLSVYAEPHTYDLCDRHAASVTPPRGWEVLRLTLSSAPKQEDDLLALADAVRESPEVQAAWALAQKAQREAEQSGREQSGREQSGREPEAERAVEPELPRRSSRDRMAPPVRAGSPGISRRHLRMIQD
ncbi:DUF3499 domain-containing protein [Nesterenkonia jeotgali]|uniref:DUF3499 domain-containing protein n=1 Tax=Nesterenkonia jeotgali TaxID=317018 RepID=A0A839FEU0_9MICC|nr:DUF3499 domain-containing protein [Nesterenkonia jeotgali]MBA8920178.1 hypothetical protein [Nesterenkonia jeotgali]